MKHEPVDLAAGRLGSVLAGEPDGDLAGPRRHANYSFSRLGITKDSQSPSPGSEPGEPPSPAGAEDKKTALPVQDPAPTPRQQERSTIDPRGLLTGKSDASPKTKRLLLGATVLAGALLLTLLLLFWPTRQANQRPPAPPVQAAQRLEAKHPAPAKVDPAETLQEARGALPQRIPAVAQRSAQAAESAEQPWPVRSLMPMRKALWAWLADLVPERRPATPLNPSTAPDHPRRATNGTAEASSTTASAEVVRRPEPATGDPENAPGLSGQEIAASVSRDANSLTPLPQIRLTGTMHGLGPQPIAMINGRLIKLGQSYKGVRIVRIGDSWVEVEFQGRRRRIGLATTSSGSEATAQKQQAARKEP